MTDPAFPLATSSWDEEEYAAIRRVTESGFFSMGEEVATFERQFAAAMGSRFAIMVNSGSSANLLMVAALRFHKQRPLPPGSEVIVPAVSWSTTYFPLTQYGCVLKFVDVDPETLNLDLGRLAEAIGPRTRAIMAVNLLGNPCDFAAIRGIVGGRDILLLEDNCESMGASFEGRQAGTFGIAGSYSAFFSHHISTMEGGLVVTDDEELHHIMLSLRAHGWTRNLPMDNLVVGRKSDDDFTEAFRFVLPGYNLRPIEMSGAIGQAQLRKLPMIVRERRRNAELFKATMAEFGEIAIQREVGQSSWFGFSMLLAEDCGVERAEILKAFRRHGVMYRPIVAGNFAKNEVVAEHVPHVIHGDLATADLIDRRGFFVGNHHYPLERQFEVLAVALREGLGRA